METRKWQLVRVQGVIFDGQSVYCLLGACIPFVLALRLGVSSKRAERVKSGRVRGKSVYWHIDVLDVGSLVGPILIHGWIFLQHRDDIFLGSVTA